MGWQHMREVAGTTLAAFGLKVLGAIAAWIIGRYLIGLALRLIAAALTRQEVDPTLQRYIANIVNVALNIVLVVQQLLAGVLRHQAGDFGDLRLRGLSGAGGAGAHAHRGLRREGQQPALLPFEDNPTPIGSIQRDRIARGSGGADDPQRCPDECELMHFRIREGLQIQILDIPDAAAILILRVARTA